MCAAVFCVYVLIELSGYLVVGLIERHSLASKPGLFFLNSGPAGEIKLASSSKASTHKIEFEC